ncbi:hypothetical protein HanRHA438_Chr15g0714251 [Helianthus annuus]|nr:hypothetical protein HanHA300_Chr15g0572021 [Helianthus annuus]KAJ0473716.1 hypothetical protein HanHA89_Chr15g0621521 [Helianthus annuus]KAJ0649292.1 hypothetical protein HanLR1_Chr15g0582611 [Helianthus annuus]KAJ0653092.1 hypothetical protein HanOQP8_Chr15g0579621 [Helianthus annuus]KAJ0845491.1 hypothetical protein HanRHA438_Chr15g0714251 [Helianthus annuus]
MIYTSCVNIVEQVEVASKCNYSLSHELVVKLIYNHVKKKDWCVNLRYDGVITYKVS